MRSTWCHPRRHARCRCRQSAARWRPRSPVPGAASMPAYAYIKHLVVGMEGRKVQWHVRPEPLGDPPGLGVDLRLRVIVAGDQQRGDLEPDIGLVAQETQGVEHRFEPCGADAAVEGVGKGLQV